METSAFEGARAESTAESPRPGFNLTLLGGWQLSRGHEVLRIPASAQRLIAFVSLNDHVSRAYVAGTLWPEVSEQHAHGSLRSTIWRTSRSCPGLLIINGETLAVADEVGVDVRELRRLFTGMLSSTRDGTANPGSADGRPLPKITALPDWLWGDLLPGWYDDWVMLERERLRQMRVHALEAMARTLAEQGLFAEALEVGMAAVGVAPLRESAHREVIRIHLAEGNLAEALRQFEVCAQLLRSDLGLEPSELMIDLMRPVVEGGRRH
jgi:DNA-binding SARP family transcriptional activator